MSDLKGPDFLTLFVRDLEASRHFYADVIGLQMSPEVRPNAFAFATQPIPFAVRKSPIDLDANPELGRSILLWFRADDSTALHDRARPGGRSLWEDFYVS